MSRDYAQRNPNPRRHTRRAKGRSSSTVPGWVWLIAGLSFGLAVAAFVYIRRPLVPPPTVDEAASEEVVADSGKTTREKPRNRSGKPPALPLPPKEKDRFTFYEILKNQEVVLPPEAAKAAQPPKPPPAAGEAPAGGGSYIIQVASYRAQTEAEKQKANLALLGIESRIESVTIDGKDTFYRVRIGPERDWARVQATMARLEANRIQGLLVKLQ
jgi:cell division protein FtsN